MIRQVTDLFLCLTQYLVLFYCHAIGHIFLSQLHSSKFPCSKRCCIKCYCFFLGNKRLARLEDLLNKFPNANIIWDEAPIGGPEGILPSDLKALAKKISPQKTFWIACNHNQPRKEDLLPGNSLHIGNFLQNQLENNSNLCHN